MSTCEVHYYENGKQVYYGVQRRWEFEGEWDELKEFVLRMRSSIVAGRSEHGDGEHELTENLRHRFVNGVDQREYLLFTYSECIGVSI